MKANAPNSHPAGFPLRLRAVALAMMAMAFVACSGGQPDLPDPRPVVIRSGARLYVEPERMQAIDAWFRAQLDNIQTDPSFWIITVNRDTPSYPWESLVIVADTAKIGVQRGYPDAEQVYQIYAHYRLMETMNRIGEFLPGGEDLEGFSLERAILARVADAWLLGRSVYQATAFEPLEELTYANENGYLDALILTARADEFPDEREAWLNEDPEAPERYRQWFLETFSREPPGMRGVD